MLKLGDKVRFVNENMEGIVTSLQMNNLVGVMVGNDFEIPVLMNELVKIGFEEKSGNSDETVAEKPTRISNNNPLGIFVAFERSGESKLQMHIHNNFTDYVMIAIFLNEQGVYKLYQKFTLERDDTKSLTSFDLNDFDTLPPLLFQFLCLDETSIKPVDPISCTYSFQPKSFHQTWKHCFFLNKQAYMSRLDEKLEKIDFQKLKDKDFTEKMKAEPIDFKVRPANIIDLHYEALVSNGYGSSSDITGFQIEVFTKTLESAFVHKMQEIVYIHGIGNMYLKNKIHTYLSKQTDLVKSFEDADPLKFGGGATLVRLK